MYTLTSVISPIIREMPGALKNDYTKTIWYKEMILQRYEDKDARKN